VNVLVTGATGFVGRNLLVRAASLGWKIFAPVRSAEKLQRQCRAEGLPADFATPLPVDPSAWPALRLDAAVHCAGVLFARSRAEYFDINVTWTLAVLRALPADCRTVVLSSQSAGGPTPEGLDARDESMPDAPVTWYGESKAALERETSNFDGPLVILRPPMILGARDTATLPLFRMGLGRVRIKPGLHNKTYSFVAVDDLVDAILVALAKPLSFGPWYVAAAQPITDRELIASAAAGPGFTLAIPQPAIRLLARVVDAVPALRASAPSFTRDRVREIWPRRWVVSGRRFESLTGWHATRSLRETIEAARTHFRRGGGLIIGPVGPHCSPLSLRQRPPGNGRYPSREAK